MKVLTTLLVLCLTLTLTSFAQRRIEKEPGDDRTAGAFTLAPASIKTGKIIVLPNDTGDWIPITAQEAKDVVKAMEILSAQASDGLIGVVSFTSFPDNRTELEKARENLARLEKIEYDKNQRAKYLTWARAVLEVWKEKIKEGVK